jgi:hypothetical protein
LQMSDGDHYSPWRQAGAAGTMFFGGGIQNLPGMVRAPDKD